jgi:hypothetical protein
VTPRARRFRAVPPIRPTRRGWATRPDEHAQRAEVRHRRRPDRRTGVLELGHPPGAKQQRLRLVEIPAGRTHRGQGDERLGQLRMLRAVGLLVQLPRARRQAIGLAKVARSARSVASELRMRATATSGRRGAVSLSPSGDPQCTLCAGSPRGGGRWALPSKGQRDRPRRRADGPRTLPTIDGHAAVGSDGNVTGAERGA